MKIPVYQSQMGIQNASGGRSADYQHPSAFVSARDNRLPHDLNQLAKGMGALGGTMHKIAIEERAQKLALDVTSDIQDVLAQDSEIRAGLQEQYRGPDAAQSMEEYGKRTEQLLNGLTAKYQNNPQAVRQIQERLGATFLAGTNVMRRYKDEQHTAYQGGVLDKQLSIMEEVYSNPDSSFEQRQQASADYVALRKQQLYKAGWDDESIQRKLDDDMKILGAKTTLQELDYLEKTNPIEGLKMMDGALTGKVDTPRGIRNNNPGNIVKTASAWDGEVEGKDDRFKTFATPEYGIKAVGENLLAYNKKGINTVSGIIKRWAPPHENNTQAYITQVSRVMNVSPDQPLDLKNPEILTRLTEAIIVHENGCVPYSETQVEQGVHAALGIAPIPEPYNMQKPEGLIVAGNIDLNNRPVVTNDDGTISTVRTISINVDGKEVLIPTVSDGGEMLSDDEAVELYHKTGKHFGKFDTPAHATHYAEALHEEQANRYRDEPQVAYLPEQVANLKYFLTPQQMAEKRASMAIAAEKQEQANAIQKYSGLSPAEAVLAVASDPYLIAKPELQKKVLNHFDLMAAAEERITKAQESALKGQLVGAIEKVDLDAPDSSRQFEQIITEAPYAMQAELTKIAKARVEGEDKITDPIAYDEAERRILAGERFDIRGDYAGKLNLVSQRRLVKMQDNEEFKEFVRKEKVLFNAEVDKYKKNMPKTQRNDLYLQFEASIPEGGFKDMAQRQKAFNVFWRSVTVDKSWALAKDIRGYQERGYAEKGYYPSKGAPYQELYAMTKEQIKSREGVEREPEEQELIKVYQAVHGVGKGE